MSENTSDKLLSANTRDVLITTIFVAGMFVVLWIYFGHILSPLLMQLLLWPIRCLYFLYSNIYTGLGNELSREIVQQNPTWLNTTLYGMASAIYKYQTAVDNRYPFTFWEMIKGYYFFDGYLKPYYLSFFAFFFWSLIKKSEANKFKEVHSMKTLILQERELYKEIYPVSKEDLIHSNALTGNFTSPLTEREFADKYDLLLSEKEHANYYQDEFGYRFRRLNKMKAKEVFDEQLKERFISFEAMSPHRKIIFVLLGVMLNDNTKELDYKMKYTIPKAQEIAKKFADNGNKFDDSFADGWVDEYYNMFRNLPNYQEYVINRNAYELTAFMTMLKAAYNYQGVLNPTSLFGWLRITDPLLFLALNYVGHQESAFVEIAGVVSHWTLEQNLNMPSVGKRTERAVEYLEKALYKYIEEVSPEKFFKK